MKCHKGKNNQHNISIVPHNQHRAFHTLFKDMNTHEIVKYLNDVWIDPNFKLIVKTTS